MCQKSVCGRGSAPDPTGAAYSAPPDPTARFKGPTSKGRGVYWRGREEREGEGKGKERVGGEKGEETRERVIPVVLFPHFEP